ncbi:hypothetical protein [Amycolatopsis sp. NPDC059657]|uniref:hypothetical protein n=1 Tax=Amycolatopsis sp. NPDC059657 TaxID=3346899 RepID=UPI0036709590
MAKLAPKATVTDTGDQKWSDGDDPVGYQVMLTAKYDDARPRCGSSSAGPAGRRCWRRWGSPRLRPLAGLTARVG